MYKLTMLTVAAMLVVVFFVVSCCAYWLWGLEPHMFLRVLFSAMFGSVGATIAYAVFREVCGDEGTGREDADAGSESTVSPEAAAPQAPNLNTPHAMTLQRQPELGHSIWVDNYISDEDGFELPEAELIEKLKQGVRDGDWLGWRLVRIEQEVIGNVA